MPKKSKKVFKNKKKQQKQRQKQSVNIKVNVDNSRKSRTNPRQIQSRPQTAPIIMNPSSNPIYIPQQQQQPNNNNDLINQIFKQNQQINELTQQFNEVRNMPMYNREHFYHSNLPTEMYDAGTQYSYDNKNKGTQYSYEPSIGSHVTGIEFDDEYEPSIYSSSSDTTISTPSIYSSSIESFSTNGPSVKSGFSSNLSNKSQGGETIFNKGPEEQQLIPQSPQNNDEEEDEAEKRRLKRKEAAEKETKRLQDIKARQDDAAKNIQKIARGGITRIKNKRIKKEVTDILDDILDNDDAEVKTKIQSTILLNERINYTNQRIKEMETKYNELIQEGKTKSANGVNTAIVKAKERRDKGLYMEIPKPAELKGQHGGKREGTGRKPKNKAK
jgi:hypothetical protein